MILNVREKWFRLALPAYLILAILGSFALSTDKSFYFEDFSKDSLGSSSYFSPIVLTIDWLAENSPTINKAHKYSHPSLRNGLLHVFTSIGVTVIAMFLAKSNFKTNKNDNFPILKNLVPLKLRT